MVASISGTDGSPSHAEQTDGELSGISGVDRRPRLAFPEQPGRREPHYAEEAAQTHDIPWIAWPVRAPTGYERNRADQNLGASRRTHRAGHAIGLKASNDCAHKGDRQYAGEKQVHTIAFVANHAHRAVDPNQQ